MVYPIASKSNMINYRLRSYSDAAFSNALLTALLQPLIEVIPSYSHQKITEFPTKVSIFEVRPHIGCFSFTENLKSPEGKKHFLAVTHTSLQFSDNSDNKYSSYLIVVHSYILYMEQ